MSRLRVLHRTAFAYERPVSASYNEARMRPANLPGQTVLSSEVAVEPSTWSADYRDYWGTVVTAFEVLRPHTELVVTAESVVEVTHAATDVAGCSWSDLSGRAFADRFTEFLVPTPATEPTPDLAELAHDAASGLEPAEAALAICAVVRAEMEYVPGVTAVHTRACEAWLERKGVCQDVTHLAVGALRSLGIPARYVSGYVQPGDAAGPVQDEVGTGQSHAWLEWWSGAWRGYDPTNAAPVADRHVVLARGREYGDVAPLRGVFAGGGSTSEQRVDVTITQED